MSIGAEAYELIKETTTTTGTGSYTLAGAVANFHAFAAHYTPGVGTFVYYMVRQGSQFESGIGELTTSTNLNRAFVMFSSSGDYPANWGAGSKDIYCTFPAVAYGVGGQHLTNLSQAPTTGHDFTTYGALRGSSAWTGTRSAGQKHNVFDCADGGENLGSGTRPARWLLRSSYGINLLDLTLPTSLLYRIGTEDAAKGPNTITNSSALAGKAARVDHSMAQVHGFGLVSGVTNPGGHQRINVGLTGTTTDATPKVIYPDDSSSNRLWVPQNSAWMVRGHVVARDNTGPDVAMWEIQSGLSRNGTSDPALHAITGFTSGRSSLFASGGVSGWDVTLSIDTTNDALEVNVTGEAATTIRWTVSLEIIQVAFV